jgi:hypothetical protein
MEEPVAKPLRIDPTPSCVLYRRRPPRRAPMAELVDASDSKSDSARSAGSIPARGTNYLGISITNSATYKRGCGPVPHLVRHPAWAAGLEIAPAPRPSTHGPDRRPISPLPRGRHWDDHGLRLDWISLCVLARRCGLRPHYQQLFVSKLLCPRCAVGSGGERVLLRLVYVVIASRGSLTWARRTGGYVQPALGLAAAGHCWEKKAKAPLLG